MLSKDPQTHHLNNRFPCQLVWLVAVHSWLVTPTRHLSHSPSVNAPIKCFFMILNTQTRVISFSCFSCICLTTMCEQFFSPYWAQSKQWKTAGKLGKVKSFCKENFIYTLRTNMTQTQQSAVQLPKTYIQHTHVYQHKTTAINTWRPFHLPSSQQQH